MIFDGFKFRRSNACIPLPSQDAAKPYYVFFGKVVPQGKPLPKKAIRTDWTWNGDQSKPIFAVPIKLKGHSLTNMAYGADGRVYLARNGQCYIASK